MRNELLFLTHNKWNHWGHGSGLGSFFIFHEFFSSNRIPLLSLYSLPFSPLKFSFSLRPTFTNRPVIYTQYPLFLQTSKVFKSSSHIFLFDHFFLLSLRSFDLPFIFLQLSVFLSINLSRNFSSSTGCYSYDDSVVQPTPVS